jgi:hypothetical protein
MKKFGVMVLALLLASSVFALLEGAVLLEVFWQKMALQNASGGNIVVNSSLKVPVGTTRFLSKAGAVLDSFSGDAVLKTVDGDWNYLRFSVLEISEASCDWKARVGDSVYDLNSVGIVDVVDPVLGTGIGVQFTTIRQGKPATDCKIKLDDLNIA